MTTCIALFRGVNVGGKNTLPMKELAAILDGLGARSVKTYIQSGNVVFASRERNASLLAKKIGTAIKRRRGFEPHVLLLEVKDLEKAVRRNPFPEAETDPAGLHAGFLAARPLNPNLEALEGIKKANERFRLIDTVFYLHAPDGIGRSKLAANAERLLGVAMTDRNWRTVTALQELAREIK